MTNSNTNFINQLMLRTMYWYKVKIILVKIILEVPGNIGKCSLADGTKHK